MQASVVVQTAVQRACAKGDLLVLQNLVDTEGLDILRFRFGKSKKTVTSFPVSSVYKFCRLSTFPLRLEVKHL